MATEPQKLMFVPFSSALDAGLWYKLSENKLNVYGLDDSPKPIFGFYYNGYPSGPCRLSLDFTAFDSKAEAPPRHCKAEGLLYLVNTIEAFKNFKQKEILQTAAEQIFNDIKSGKAMENPNLLTQFIMLSFADLKKYHYYYWYAFPCISLPDNVLVNKQRLLKDCFTNDMLENLMKAYDEFQSLNKRLQAFFLFQQTNDGKIIVHPVSMLTKLMSENQKVIFAFYDPCPASDFPGWPLRNYLYFISYVIGDKVSEIEVVCFKDKMQNGVRSISHSLALSLKIPPVSHITECSSTVGWEKNERGKMGPRMVNLSHSMDPNILAESAVGLNLKLMRWRLIPDLDLELISQTKCLLLGAGTLGCNVARCLIGWGIRNLTLVDNGKISYSNPVRQSLFVFEDSLNGKKPKAETAAESLKKIIPGLNAVGLTLSIPMPGHHVTDGVLEQTKKDITFLEQLISEHDVIFLLMDTRESRWLPSLIAASQQKIVINAALGFDTFLVLRHGLRNLDDVDNATETDAEILKGNLAGNKLGCYFCNDVVAPGDSTKDRTLDQQCTVSRPGMSMIAAGIAVELMVSILQHPLRQKAPACTSTDSDFQSESESCLGIVPHQIRGFLSHYHIVLPAARAFKRCTACSDTVIKSYQKDGFDFLFMAFNIPSFLEDLTGLTQMQMESIDADILSLSDDDDDTGSSM
ncbi:ubiquitin-like modifier-activating enzyme ATG7 [Octopus bimaculoides]|uniref:Ubiquitin-like modifier-activating enzyme ATG7 n=1 Tax=Octopus bimaculoides TaxID=37653 RepID=A0A0L8FZ62_OCTBM|nr:ubiquitin-like modifier-activating enzyme ATG7 [Octopus bimaculoides]|eukprot:XP_014785656.1 PREDICTED: ubiquitin-like modifier-activating enzyme ATG7 [Octopus bimaculoides]